jgi:glycosyltransferase involved in cell wall biosynthesis
MIKQKTKKNFLARILSTAGVETGSIGNVVDGQLKVSVSGKFTNLIVLINDTLILEKKIEGMLSNKKVSFLIDSNQINTSWLSESTINIALIGESKKGEKELATKQLLTKDFIDTVKYVNTEDVDIPRNVILQSGIWNNEYYLTQLNESRIIASDLIKDYLMFGARMGVDGNFHFSSQYYISENLDVTTSGLNPLYHYIEYGEKENRKPNPYFTPAIYLKNNEDVVLGFDGCLLGHYSLYGYGEDRKIIDSFTQITSQVFTSLSTSVLDDFQTWCEFNTWNQTKFWDLKSKLATFDDKDLPKLSLIMPVYNPPVKYFKKVIQTILAQVYENWELCIADDCSTNPEINKILEECTALDDRILVTFRETNGHMSAATNSAADLATGDLLVFIDQDDEITPDALAEIAIYVADNPECDVLYSDDDKNDVNGNRFAPQFKPDWSPELLLSYMYFCHIFVVRRSLFDEVGGIRLGYEGSQDYDLALRVTERARHVGHIPKVLYHWRVIPGSTAASGNEKHYSFEAGIKAVQDALDRRGIPAVAEQPEWAEKGGVGIYSHLFADDGPSVAVIIPTKNQAEITERLLISLEETTYKNFKVYIVNNESDEQDAIDLLANTKHCVFDIPNKDVNFSYAYINNEAVNKVSEELILFLNNDTEVITPNWLSQMVGYKQIEGVGAVGARLLYPDNTVQHAGVLHDLHHGLPGHSLKHLPDFDGGYMGFAKVLRNYSCVTAACLLMDRNCFNRLGQFNDVEFSVAYNDVDLCYRIINDGQRVVYAPTAELYHYEGKSRGFSDNPREEVTFVEKYKDFNERYYNPNLSNTPDTFKVSGRAYCQDNNESLNGRRIAFFSHNLNLEGAPIQLMDTAAGLKERCGIIPIFVSPSDGILREQLEEKGIEVAVIPIEVIGGIQNQYGVVKARLAGWLNKLEVESVFANTVLSFWAVDIAKSNGLPAVWIIHESEEPFSHIQDWSQEANLQARQALADAYQVIFVSEATKHLFEPLATKQNFSVIYNGFDDELMAERVPYSREEARAKLNLKDDEVYSIIVGTVCDRKGQTDFIKAIRGLSDDVLVKSRFAIIGDRASSYSDEMHQLHSDLSPLAQGHTYIIGETRDVGLYYAAADVFVCCSKLESFPRVIQEAMHGGLAIVTTPVFGIAEQVKDNVSAMFFEPSNTEKLAELLEYVIVDRKKRDSLGCNAKLHLKRLPNHDAMISDYSELLIEVSYL